MSNADAELLAFYLEIIEGEIRADLAGRRAARNACRQMDLADALEKLQQARIELARCPEGARLALLAMGIHLDRLRPDVQDARVRYAGGLKGQERTKAKKGRRVGRRHQEIRKHAASLSADLSAAAKAKIIARKKGITLSESRIRRILTPVK